jgi:hypothetical protein
MERFDRDTLLQTANQKMAYESKLNAELAVLQECEQKILAALDPIFRELENILDNIDYWLSIEQSPRLEPRLHLPWRRLWMAWSIAA